MSDNKDFIDEAMEKVAEIKDYCYAEGKRNGGLDVWDFLKVWANMSQIERKKRYGVTRTKDLIEKYNPTEFIKRTEESIRKSEEIDPEEICNILLTMSIGTGWCSRERWALESAVEYIESHESQTPQESESEFRRKARMCMSESSYLDNGITQC